MTDYFRLVDIQPFEGLGETYSAKRRSLGASFEEPILLRGLCTYLWTLPSHAADCPRWLRRRPLP
jgi:hypothetical protein